MQKNCKGSSFCSMAFKFSQQMAAAQAVQFGVVSCSSKPFDIFRKHKLKRATHLRPRNLRTINLLIDKASLAAVAFAIGETRYDGNVQITSSHQSVSSRQELSATPSLRRMRHLPHWLPAEVPQLPPSCTVSGDLR